MSRIKKILSPEDIPLLFISFNYFILFPIIGWPIALFSMIFMFDNPNNKYNPEKTITLILIYPFALVLSYIISNYLYRRNSYIGWLYLFFSVTFVYYFLITLF